MNFSTKQLQFKCEKQYTEPSKEYSKWFFNLTFEIEIQTRNLRKERLLKKKCTKNEDAKREIRATHMLSL